MRKLFYGALLLCFIAPIALEFAPFVSLFIGSFAQDRGPIISLNGLSLKWYEEALSQDEFRSGLINSFEVAIAASAISAVLGFLSGLFAVRHLSKGIIPYALAVSLPSFVPLVLSGLALLMYFELCRLSNSWFSIVAGHVCYSSPFAFLLMFIGYSSLDSELEVAALNLGATPLQVTLSILLPQMWRYVMAAVIICFLISWDEFALAWFVGGFYRTLPVIIYGKLSTGFSPALNAMAVMSTSVSVGLFLFAGRLLKGLGKVHRV